MGTQERFSDGIEVRTWGREERGGDRVRGDRVRGGGGRRPTVTLRAVITHQRAVREISSSRPLGPLRLALTRLSGGTSSPCRSERAVGSSPSRTGQVQLGRERARGNGLVVGTPRYSYNPSSPPPFNAKSISRCLASGASLTK